MSSGLHPFLALSPLSITTTLLVFSAIHHRVSALPHTYESLSSSDLSCRFSLAGYSFDLCPLADALVHIVEVNPENPSSSASHPGAISKAFTLSFLPGAPLPVTDGDFVASADARPHKSSKQDPDHTPLACSDARESGACVGDNHKSDKEAPHRSLRWMPGVFATPTVEKIEWSGAVGLPNPNGAGLWEEIETLSITLNPTTRAPASRILLICNSSAVTSVLEQIQGVRDELLFRWRTPQACPVLPAYHSTQAEDDFRILDAEGENPPPEGEQPPAPDDGEQPNGEDSLKPGKPNWSSSRRWMAGMILMLGIIAIGGYVVVTSRGARHFVLEKMYSLSFKVSPIVSWVSGSVRPSVKRIVGMVVPSVIGANVFRQGDSRLVQWAQEDMSLQEDFMVNGSGAYELDGEDWDGTSLDEYIPLTISPKWGKKMKNYGTAPSKEKASPVPRGRLFTQI